MSSGTDAVKAETSVQQATAVSGSARNPAGPIAARWGSILVVPVIILVGWWVTALVVDSAVFPTPVESMQHLAKDLADSGFQRSVGITLVLLVIGWGLAVVVGTILGFILGQSAFWSEVFETPLFALYSIPKVTLYPIFLLLLGIGNTSLVAFAFFHGVFPIALLVMAATKGIDPNLFRLASGLVLSWTQKLRLILLPAILPAVVTAVRIGFGLTLLGLILGQMFSSDVGLGRELIQNVSNVRVDRIAGQVVFIAVIAIIPGFLLRSLEQRVTSKYKNID